MTTNATMTGRPTVQVDFSNQALIASLHRLDDAWEAYQGTRNRDAVYCYLTAVFELVMWWAHEGNAVIYARRALWIRFHRPSSRAVEPFASVILCTSDLEKADDKVRSKWSRVMRYAAAYKDRSERFSDFVRRKGGINQCAARYTRRLGRNSGKYRPATFVY